MGEVQPLVFEDVRIEVPWGYVEGRWYGNRKVRPILALHGWQNNLGTWDRLIPLMPRHVGVLCIDLPGHGRSSKHPLGIGYHVVDYVYLIIRVIKAYRWKKVSLMGHSMGAIICFYYTTFYPHMVDMLIQIDLIKARYDLTNKIEKIRMRIEKRMAEDERLEQLHIKEPPSYSYEELEIALYNGSSKSVLPENCKHLINRSIAQSKQYPEKFYFSRDPRIKYHIDGPGEHGLGIEMAKRIRNLPYLLVRSDKESYMSPRDEEIVDVLKSNNPHFEYHRVDGTHHMHLNNPDEVAKFINPFILKHRPVVLDRWSLDDSERSINEAETRSKL